MVKPRKYYPAFIDITDKKCVVVGGGKVAERKVRELIKAGADVRVISPDLTPGLQRELERGRIRHSARKFRITDLKDAFMAIAATNDIDTNNRVAEHGDSLMVNVVDSPGQCNFIVPASMRRGPLTIAISTSGASPAMARSIRRELEKTFSPEVGKALDNICRQRDRAIRDIKDPKERKKHLKALGSPDILSSLLSKNRAGDKGDKR